MGIIALASLTVLVVMASAQTPPPKVHYDVSNARPLFENFIKKYNRIYKDEADKEVHYHAFVENIKNINELNEKSTSAVFEINKFADYTDDETKSFHGAGVLIPDKTKKA